MRPRTWLRRKRYQRAYPHVSIGMGAMISGATTIDRGSSIGEVAYLADTTVGAGVSIGRSCRVSNSRLGDNASVGDGVGITESSLEDRVVIYGGCGLTDVNVGRYTYITSGAAIGHTSIGRFCSIGPDLICGYGDHPTRFVSTSPVFFSTRRQCGHSFTERDCFEELKPVRIGHDVWIGARVFVRDGVTVGDGAIIGAGAVVVNDVPAYAVVGGVPARVIRLRFDESTVARLRALRWWDWSDEKLKRMQPLFAQADVQSFLDAAGE